MYDRVTGRSRGFGFVTFHDSSVVSQLVGRLLEMRGKTIEVKAAQPKQITNSPPHKTMMYPYHPTATFYAPPPPPLYYEEVVSPYGVYGYPAPMMYYPNSRDVSQ